MTNCYKHIGWNPKILYIPDAMLTSINTEAIGIGYGFESHPSNTPVTFSGSVVAERLRAPNSNSDVSDQQSVGSNPQPWHLCP